MILLFFLFCCLPPFFNNLLYELISYFLYEKTKYYERLYIIKFNFVI